MVLSANPGCPNLQRCQAPQQLRIRNLSTPRQVLLLQVHLRAKPGERELVIWSEYRPPFDNRSRLLTLHL